MHRKLLLMAFEKMRGELVVESGVNPSANKCANRLSEIISEEFSYGPKSLRTLKKKAEKGEEVEFHIPQPEVVHALAKYLDYENYEEFILMNKGREQKRIDDGGVLLISPTDGTAQEKGRETVTGLKKNNKFMKGIAYAGIFFIAITLSVYLFVDRQKWMVWNGNHYEIKPFDPELERKGVLSIYDENNYQYLKKITPTCNTQFFNGDGSVRIWYGKNREGELEYFSSHGLHPQTGKNPKTHYPVYD